MANTRIDFSTSSIPQQMGLEWILMDSYTSLSLLFAEQDGSIPLYNIPCMLRMRSRKTPEKFPDCLVLTFPELRLSSSNIKDLENTTDIPVSITKSKPVEDSLPWSLNGQGFSIYTITPRSTTPSIYTNLSRLAGGQLRSECCYIWEPAVWTMFLAASHADPKDKQSTLTTLHDSLSSVGVRPVIDQIQDSSFDARSQCQPSLGLCVHIDLASVMIGISKHQVCDASSFFNRFRATKEACWSQ